MNLGNTDAQPVSIAPSIHSNTQSTESAASMASVATPPSAQPSESEYLLMYKDVV